MSLVWVARYRSVWRIAVAVPVVVGLAACGAVEPPAGRWTALGLEGKWVTAVAQTPWGLFAGTRDDGVFRLETEGAQWQPLGLAHLRVYCMLVVPAAQPRLLVGVGIRTPWDPRESSVFATEDGATWTPADGGLALAGGGSAFSLAVDPGRPDRLYLGDGINILRSEDGGATWAYVLGDSRFAGNGVWSIVVSPARDGTVWASVIGSFGTSTVVRSRDWGERWEGFPPFPEVELGIYALAADPRDTSRLWAGLDGGAILSEDAGETWRTSLSADYATISALVWRDGDLLAIGMYRSFATNGAGEVVGEEINRLRLFRLPGGAGAWEEMDVPSDVRGGRSATIDSRGRLVVGTAGSGVWVWEP
jgi:hypothetical protein